MSHSLIDQESLNRFVQDDPDLLGDLSVIFVRTLPGALARLNYSVQNSDPDLLRENAHVLKSQLSYFFCEALVNQAMELEQLGRQGITNEAETIAFELIRGIEQLLVELNRLTGLNLSIEED